VNAQQLQLADGTKIEAFRCSECGQVWHERNAQSSEQCCVCVDCESTFSQKNGRSNRCDKCRTAHYAKLEADRLDKATEIADYNGPVVLGDEYWESLSAFLESRDEEYVPEFIHTCHVHAYALDANNIIQDMLENASVEDHDHHTLCGVKEFEAAVTAFNKANEKVVYWSQNSKHKVRTVSQPDAQRDGEGGRDEMGNGK
jgi:hypothetical protein